MSGVRAADPPVAQVDPRPVAAGDGGLDLRRLTLVGIALPVGFLLAVETLRLVVVDRVNPPHRWHLVLAVLTVACATAFGAVVFRYVGRAHRTVLRHNRELSAVNAVATAIRGDLDADGIIEAALRAVVAATGAAEGSVSATAPQGRLLHEDGITWQRVVRAAAGPDGGGRIVDIPLLAGPTPVGALRVRVPGDEPALSADILRNIGEQVGSAVQRAQLFADLRRRKREGHALYDLLLQISGQQPVRDTLASVVGRARDLLDADRAVLCLTEATSRFLPWDPPAPDGGALCLEPDRVAGHGAACPVRSAPDLPVTLDVPLRGPKGTLGTLWVGRYAGEAFGGRDSAYLVTLSELAVIAIAGARMRDNERHAAILAERERIARELHDSLAQVLGVTHLRLHAVVARPEVTAATGVHAELADLANLCHEAYRDVREAILGLRESSRPDRALLESLHAYAERFSRQSGIRTTVQTALDAGLALLPRCEVQVIRVIQEALTNARKHSGARTAIIRIAADAGGITFVIEDDGHGFDVAAMPADRDGFGLVSMAERVRLVNGTLTIDSSPGVGTRVTVLLPPGARQATPTVTEVQA